VPRLPFLFSTLKLRLLVGGGVYLTKKKTHDMEKIDMLFHMVVRPSKDFSRNDIVIAGNETLKLGFTC
jgi:hypothetical protein